MGKNKRASDKVGNLLGVEKLHLAPKRKEKSLPKLTQEQLEKLSTQRLLQVLKAARACYSAANKGLHCECCGTPYLELYPDDRSHKKDLKDALVLYNYYDLIRNILSMRENVKKPTRKR